MRIVPKSDTKQTLINTNIDSSLKGSLFRCYVTRNANQSEIADVQELLRKVRTSDSWIECDCKLDKSAYLFPRKLQTDTYTIVRPSAGSQHAHTADCPYYLIQQHEPEDGIPDFNVLGEGEVSESVISEKLFQILRFLLVQGAVSDYTAKSYYNHIHILTKVKEQLERLPHIAPELGIHNIIQSHDRYLISFLKMLNKRPFPEGMCRQGYFWGLASHVTDNTITLMSGRELKVENTINNPSNDTGPCWVIMLYSESSPGFYKASHALALPAYSQALPLLLSTGEERPMFKQLLSVTLKAKEISIPISISKLFNRQGAMEPGFTVNTDTKLIKVRLISRGSGAQIAYEQFETDRAFRDKITEKLHIEG